MNHYSAYELRELYQMSLAILKRLDVSLDQSRSIEQPGSFAADYQRVVKTFFYTIAFADDYADIREVRLYNTLFSEDLSAPLFQSMYVTEYAMAPLDKIRKFFRRLADMEKTVRETASIELDVHGLSGSLLDQLECIGYVLSLSDGVARPSERKLINELIEASRSAIFEGRSQALKNIQSQNTGHQGGALQSSITLMNRINQSSKGFAFLVSCTTALRSKTDELHSSSVSFNQRGASLIQEIQRHADNACTHIISAHRALLKLTSELKGVSTLRERIQKDTEYLTVRRSLEAAHQGLHALDATLNTLNAWAESSADVTSSSNPALALVEAMVGRIQKVAPAWDLTLK